MTSLSRISVPADLKLCEQLQLLSTEEMLSMILEWDVTAEY